jgi:D-alanine-D-alanine ligase
MPSKRLTLLYNEPVLPAGHPEAESELEIVETMGIVQRILRNAGFVVSRLGVGNDLQTLIDGLCDQRPDAVFNLFEGLADRPFTEDVVAGVLEWQGIAFTGCPAVALSLARDKQRAKYLMRGADLPTAPFFTVHHTPVPKCRLTWPVIVKPALHDASVGIDQASVVTSQRQMERRVAHVLDRWGPALVEQFVGGREFLVSLLEVGPARRAKDPLVALPLAEIEFTDSEVWPIYSYDAKWAPTSSEFKSSPLKVPVIVDDALQKRIVDVACRAYRLLGCRDYARVDLRVTPEGDPYILEVNPNPYINSIMLIDGLTAVNRGHSQFVCEVARAALARRPRRKTRPARRIVLPAQEAS